MKNKQTNDGRRTTDDGRNEVDVVEFVGFVRWCVRWLIGRCCYVASFSMSSSSCRCSLRCRRRGWFVTNTMSRCRGRLIGVAVAVARLWVFVVVVDCVVVVAERAALFVVGSAVNWRNDFVVGVCAALRNNSLLSLSELPWTDARVSSWLLPPQSWLVTPSLCFFCHRRLLCATHYFPELVGRALLVGVAFTHSTQPHVKTQHKA